MTSTPALLARDAGRGIFGADAHGYHAVRFGYPPELIDRIFAYAGDPAPRVLEIGPGTGLATRLLLDRGAAALVAVEPDAALADFLEANIADPRFAVVRAGLVEADLAQGALDAGAFDLAASACAFHWVDPDRGFAALHRVLRPGGSIALWWHAYRNPGHDPFFDALQPDLAGVTLPPSETGSGYLYLDEARQRADLAGRGFVDIDYAVYRSDRSLDAAEMRGLYASFSFVRLLDADRRARLLDRIVDLVETRFAGRAPNIVFSPLYLARRPAG